MDNKILEFMTRTEIEEKVKAFLIDDLEIEEENIFPEAKLKEDMGIDSLDYVDIVVIVEKNFGFRIKAEEMAPVKTLTQFYDYIESKVN
jgi:acyl carrier protein